jgi:hypothetical protein
MMPLTNPDPGEEGVPVTLNQRVAGSSPATPTNEIKSLELVETREH